MYELLQNSINTTLHKCAVSVMYSAQCTIVYVNSWMAFPGQNLIYPATASSEFIALFYRLW